MADKNLSHRLKPGPGAEAVGIIPVDMTLGQLRDVDDSAKRDNFVLTYDATTQKYIMVAQTGGPGGGQTSGGGGSVILEAHSGTFLLPTVAQTTLTTTAVNTLVNHYIPSLTGSDVTGFITNTVSGGRGRLTFPKAGFITLIVEGFITIHSTTIGTSGSVGHLVFEADWYSSTGTKKDGFVSSEVIHDASSLAYRDPVSICAGLIPVMANDYIEFKIGFETNVTNKNIRISIPAATDSQRENVDVFFYDRMEVEDWAKKNNATLIPANKLPSTGGGGGLTQAQVDLRVQEGTWDWSHKGNTDPIPKQKLKNAAVKESIDDFDFNDGLVLRDFGKAGTDNSIVLPTNYATKYRYLLFGTHVNAEYGIFDTKYLNAQPGATVRDESGAYTFTKATRTLSGIIKGAYLYNIDEDNIFEEDGWIRSPRNNQNQPTTSANDGHGGIDISKGTADKYEYFAFRVWGAGTLQFLPKAVYDNLTAGQNRIFRVWDEANTKTMRVSLTAGNYGFNSYNEATSSETNDCRSLAFLNFAKQNVLVNKADATATTLTLPEGYTDSDLLIAVTKQPTDSFYKIWTIRTKFTDAPNNRITEATRVFNPAASIIYASLVNFHSSLEIKAEDVTTDDSDFDNIVGKNVQEALDDIDNKINTSSGGGVSDTPKRTSTFPDPPKEGEEIYLTAPVVAKGPDIQTESFSNTFLDGEDWGSFGWCSYHDTQGQLFNLGHNTESLPDGVLIVSNKNIVVADGTNSDYLAVIVEDKDGTKHARKLTFNNRNNYKITGSDHAVNVDSYTYNADLPAGPWHEMYFLRTGGTGASETINANTNGIGSAAVTGKVTDAVSFGIGSYIRKDSIWQPTLYKGQKADIDKPLTFAVQETLPGAPQGKSVPFVLTNNVYATQNPFDGINNVFYDPRTTGDTHKRWGVRIPPQTPDEEYPLTLNFDGKNLGLHFFQTDSNGGLFVSRETASDTSLQLSSAISKPINIQLQNGLWLNQTGEKKINRTLDKDGISTVARRIPRLTNLPNVEYGIAGQMFYLLENKTVRGVAILDAVLTNGDVYSGYYLSPKQGNLTPGNNKVASILSVGNSNVSRAEHRNKTFLNKNSTEADFTGFWYNGVEHDLTATSAATQWSIDGLDGEAFLPGHSYAINVKQGTTWIYPDVTLPKDKYIIWNGYQFIETHLAMKDYAARGSSEKIPKDDYSTTLTVAEYNALTANNRIPNHVYYGI